MYKAIDRNEVVRLAREGGQVVEVLPEDEFEAEHLPGAINIPLAELTRERARKDLDPARPVITYCQDQL